MNDVLVSSASDGVLFSTIALVFLTAVVTLGTLAFIILQYIWFHYCGAPIGIITYTLVFCIAFYVLVPLRTRKDASIFTSSIVAAYITFLCWSAIASMPDEECNTFANKQSNQIA